MASAAAVAIESPSLAEPVTIPIQVVKGFPVLVVRIADRDVPLMLDLGGYENITLTPEAMRVAGIVPLHDEHESWKDAKGNEVQGGRFIIKEMRLGDAVFHEVEGHIAAFADSFPAIPIGNSGHIGEALLRSYKVLLDYRGATMTLIAGDSRNAENDGCRGTVVPFLPEWEGEPISKAKTDLGMLTFVWDTGASASAIRHSLVTVSGAEATQASFRSATFELGGVDFGPLELRPFEFAEPAGVDGFIGANFFADHVVCVDFPNKRFLVR
jgi:hypothetical protein